MAAMLAGALLTAPAAALDDESAVAPRLSTLEAGIYAQFRQTRLGDLETVLSLPATWTRFHSDRLDFRLEGWLSRSFAPRRGWFSFVAGPGLTFRFGPKTSATPHLRTGLAFDRAGAASFLVYGADLGLKHGFDVAPSPADRHRFVELELKGGFFGHAALSAGARSFSHRFVHVAAGYDFPLLRATWNGGHRRRAKLGLRLENYFGAGRPADRYFLATISVRKEVAATSALIRKVDLALGFDEAFRFQASAGLVAGF